MYWVSCIIQNDEHATPWHCAASDPCLDLSGAMDLARDYTRKFRCLSVWVDKSGSPGSRPVTVFHKCLVNAVGDVEPWADQDAT